MRKNNSFSQYNQNVETLATIHKMMVEKNLKSQLGSLSRIARDLDIMDPSDSEFQEETRIKLLRIYYRFS